MVSFEFPQRSRIFRKLTRSRSPRKHKDRQGNSPACSLSEDLWGRAYQILTKEHKDLVKRYEHILRIEEGTIDDPATSGSIAHSPRRLTELAKSKLNALDDSRWKVSIRDKTFVVQDGFDKFIKCISAARDFVDQIASSEPHAALAWAGVCICLPLLLNPTKQYDDAQAGLLEIPTIIIRYQVLESLYRNSTVGNRSEHNLLAEFEKRLTGLYCSILQYQVRAVCQWSRNKANQYFRDIFKADEWDKLFKDIQDADNACKAIAETFNAGTLDGLNGHHLRLHDKVDSFHLKHQDTLNDLSSMVKSLEEAETQRKQQQSKEEQEEEQRCHQAFGPSLYVEHKNRNPVRVPGTCNWFLNSESFIAWKNQKQSCLLWVSADPGCGKSVLTRSTIDERLLYHKNQAPSVCYFFFKDGLAQQQGAAKCISAILHQLFAARPNLIRYALQAYRVNGSNVSSSFSATWDILITAASDPDAGEIVCVLDALDECKEEDRYFLIDTLKEFYGNLVQKESPQLKFLVTSRPYTDIQRRFTALTDAFPTVHLKGEHESEAISKEINLVICKIVPDISRELRLSADTEAQLRDRLLEVPNRTYLWLHLALEEVRRSVGATTTKRVNRLISGLIKNVPRTVEDAYDKILNRDYKKYYEDRRRLLSLVLAALRPLTVAEASVALPLSKIGNARTIADLDPEDECHFRTTVQTLCGLFVSVVDGKLFLLHQTAREYLLRPGSYNRGSSIWKHTFDLKVSQYMIAKCCIYYLRLKEFESCNSSSVDLEIMISQHRFLAYAAYYWAQHYDDYDQNKLFDMALDLCNPESTFYETWTRIEQFCARAQNIIKPSSTYGWSQLMVVARLGFNGMATQLLEAGENPSAKAPYTGRMALDIAAEYGHSLVAKTLLNTKSKISLSHEDISHALIYACEGGHLNAAELLLSQNADVNTRIRGATPLHYAVQEDHVDVVRLLLESSEIDVDAAGGLYGTSLQNAAYRNYIEIAQLLLEKGANPNLNGRDDSGALRGVPMALAASNGNLRMISLLKKHNADINGTVGVGKDWLAESTRRCEWNSPIMMAASEAKLEAMSLLLQSGADLRQKIPQRLEPDAETMDIFERVCTVRQTGFAPKSMKFLLEYEKDANPDIPKLALLAAARHGDFVMLQLVLEETPPVDKEVLIESFQILQLRIDVEQAQHGLTRRLPDLLAMKSHLEERLPKVNNT